MQTGNTGELLDRALMVLSTFEELRAALLFGSHADGTADSFSDVDVLVVASKAVPSGEERLRQYHAAGLGETLSFDGAEAAFRRDVVKLQEQVLDLYWIAMPAAERWLHDLSRDFDADETLPAILGEAQPLYDPHDTLARLRKEVPVYPGERSAHLVQRILRVARGDYGLVQRLEAAVLREDLLAYSRVRQELVELVVEGVFAVNRAWYRPRSRVLERVAGFPVLSMDGVRRIETVVGGSDIAGVFDAVQGLLGEL